MTKLDLNQQVQGTLPRDNGGLASVGAIVWVSSFPMSDALGTDGDYSLDPSSGKMYGPKGSIVPGSWAGVSSFTIGGGGGSVPNVGTFHRVVTTGLNALVIKNSTGILYGWHMYNAANYPVFVKLYNQTTVPNPATDTPKQVIPIQAGSAAPFPPEDGISYTVGIAMLVTLGIDDTDNTPVAAKDCVIDIFYV